jgi:hypothetical protein
MAGRTFTYGARTVSVGANGNCELVAGSKRVRVIEIQFTANTATAGNYGIGRPATAGITPTLVQLINQQAQGKLALAGIAVAWGTPPVNPTAANMLRRFSLVSQVGATFIWRPEELWLPPAGTLIIANISTPAVGDANWTIEEEV